MSKQPRKSKKNDGASLTEARTKAKPRRAAPIRRAAEPHVPEVGVRETWEPYDRPIYTQEGMLEDAYLISSRRVRREPEKSLAELVASVTAKPVVEEPAHESVTSEPLNEPGMEAVRRTAPGGLFALLGVAAFFIALAALLLMR